MSVYQLLYEKKHVFAVLEKGKYLLDTGSPISFGKGPFEFAGLKRDVRPDMADLISSMLGKFMGIVTPNMLSKFIGIVNPNTLSKFIGIVNPNTLSEFIGVETKGLIGNDILNSFDSIWDIKEGNLVCGENLSLDGEKHQLEFYMEHPIMTAEVFGRERKFFFDTGAQISYFQSPELENCEYIGTMEDFYPIIGRFNTRTYRLPVRLGNNDIEIVAGKFEENSLMVNALTNVLKMSGTTGIIGNEIIINRKLGYFPGKKLLVLS